MAGAEITGYGFHTHDNLYWKRENNGFVTLTKLDVNNQVEWTHTLTDSVWASVMSHVSFFGGDGQSHSEALEFHNKKMR